MEKGEFRHLKEGGISPRVPPPLENSVDRSLMPFIGIFIYIFLLSLYPSQNPVSGASKCPPRGVGRTGRTGELGHEDHKPDPDPKAEEQKRQIRESLAKWQKRMRDERTKERPPRPGD